MARAADVPLTIDDFQEVSDRTPYLADLKYVHCRPYITLDIKVMLI
jgi:dihydroxyacid dehydratase/phosphogluconate dehydratase